MQIIFIKHELPIICTKINLKNMMSNEGDINEKIKYIAKLKITYYTNE
jgi:hypothetical protein